VWSQTADARIETAVVRFRRDGGLGAALPLRADAERRCEQLLSAWSERSAALEAMLDDDFVHAPFGVDRRAALSRDVDTTERSDSMAFVQLDDVARIGAVESCELRVDWTLRGADGRSIVWKSAPFLAQWRERALAERSSPWRQLHALVALCRCGSSEDLEPVLNALSLIDSGSLSGSQRIAWLRAHELALMRLSPTNPSQRERVADLLLPKFPSGDDREDQLLIGLLAHVDAKGLLDRALPMLTPMRPSTPPAWAEIAQRNKNYGGAIATMLSAMPPAQQIAIAYALRNVKAGWTMEQREAYFAFMAEAKKQKGGASYQGFCKRIVEDAYDNCSDAEKAQLADAVGKARAEPKPFVATQPKGPGRRWQLDEAKAIARAQLQRDRDLQNGRNLFYATGCAGCHRFSGEGKGVGPDLTSLGNKFSADDVLEAILEPSKVVSDQFAGAVLTKKDGSTVFGRVSRREDGGSIVHEVVTATADAAVVRVADGEVARVEPAKLSVMPQGLVDRCSEAELMDLLAYLLSRGN